MKALISASAWVLAMTLFVSTVLQAQVAISPMPVQALSTDSPTYQVAQQALTAAISGDTETLEGLLHPDFVAYGADTDSLDREGYVNLWKGYHAGAHDLGISQGQMFAVDTEAIPSIGSAAMFWGLAQWTPNEAPQPVYAWTHMVIGISEGKVRLLYNFQDQLAVMMQAGFTLVPPGGNDSGK